MSDIFRESIEAVKAKAIVMISLVNKDKERAQGYIIYEACTSILAEYEKRLKENPPPRVRVYRGPAHELNPNVHSVVVDSRPESSKGLEAGLHWLIPVEEK